MDLLNEDAQQRARGRRIRNITHTNTVTTVYEEGGGRPSVLPPERPVRVRHHPHHHHAEDVAVAERVDGVDAREKKRYKNSFLHQTVLVPCVANVEALWPLNANSPRPDVANSPNDNGV